MDEEPIEEQPLELNPEPEVLRKENAEDALLAQGIRRDEQLDKMIEQADEPPEVEQLDVNEFLDDVDADDPKEVGEQQEVKEAMQQPAPPPIPGKLPKGQGVDPKAIRAAQAKRLREKQQPPQPQQKIPTPEVVQAHADPVVPQPKTPEPVVRQPDVQRKDQPEIPTPEVRNDKPAAQSDDPVIAARAEAWKVRDAANGFPPLPPEFNRVPPGPDNRDEAIATDHAVAPQGNDRDLNNRILDMLRQYLDQERMFKHSVLNILQDALVMLQADHVRLEHIEAAFERDREAY